MWYCDEVVVSAGDFSCCGDYFFGRAVYVGEEFKSGKVEEFKSGKVEKGERVCGVFFFVLLKIFYFLLTLYYHYRIIEAVK